MSGGASAVFPATSVLLVEDTILAIYVDGLPAFQPDPSEWKHHFIPAVWLSFSKGGALWIQGPHPGRGHSGQ